MKTLLKKTILRIFAPILLRLEQIQSSQDRTLELLNTNLGKSDEIFTRLSAVEQRLSQFHDNELLSAVNRRSDEMLVRLDLIEQAILRASKSIEDLHAAEQKPVEENDFSQYTRDVFTTLKLLRENIQQNNPPNYEDYLERIYSKIIDRGDGVVDIGCHAGRHLVHFLDLIAPSGKALAFEPLPHLAEALKQMFPQENVTIINKALSNVTGEAPFFNVENYQEESGLRKRIYNRADASPQQIIVQVDVLDHYIDLFDVVKFIKIDTEGAEVDILHGAKAFIHQYRPFISIEYGFPSYSVFGHTKQTLWDFAGQENYHITDIFGNVMISRDVWEVACDSIYWDYILVPAEKLSWFFDRIHA